MKASEIMTSGVVTVHPDTRVREIAEMMTKNRISGVPVVDADGKLVGILSESDLLHRTETGTERHRKWWLRMFADSESMAREYAKAHGLTAADIMSTALVTVDGDANLGQVADLLDRRKLKRLPVVKGGRLVGIITRGDLVKALVATAERPAPVAGDDAAVSKAISDRLRHVGWLDASCINVAVSNGVAEMNGIIPSNDQRRALHILVEETQGVTSVVDKVKVGSLPMSA